jgi:hypothetical protein
MSLYAPAGSIAEYPLYLESRKEMKNADKICVSTGVTAGAAAVCLMTTTVTASMIGTCTCSDDDIDARPSHIHVFSRPTPRYAVKRETCKRKWNVPKMPM